MYIDAPMCINFDRVFVQYLEWTTCIDFCSYVEDYTGCALNILHHNIVGFLEVDKIVIIISWSKVEITVYHRVGRLYK